jgi:8-oxo-dGTP pyrophosphatase MutT (NUDIX family)
MSRSRASSAKNPQQAAVIPIRRKRDGIEVCLIRRKDSDAWGIPKGFIDPGDTPDEAALNEADEEAGLEGEIVGDAIGTYEYTKRGSVFTVAVYVMNVLDQEKTWSEMSFRERRWTAVEEAQERLARHPVRPLLERAVAQFKDDVS